MVEKKKKKTLISKKRESHLKKNIVTNTKQRPKINKRVIIKRPIISMESRGKKRVTVILAMYSIVS